MRPVREFLTRVTTVLVPVLLGGAGPVLVVATALGPAAPAAAATAPCVAVVVDARLAGGPLRTSCAKGDPASGLAALTAAGFSYAFVPRQPGQVCQIDGQPACSRNSATTYWSYWHRAAGSSHWVYSSEGAATYDPAPGSTEAWVWQEGGKREPPDIAFRTVCPAPRSTPRSTPSSTPTSARASAPATTAAAPSRTATSATPKHTHPRGGSMGGTAHPTPTTSAAAAAPTGSTSTAAAPRPREAATSRPSWLGTALALAAVAVLGAGAVVRSRRRPGGRA